MFARGDQPGIEDATFSAIERVPNLQEFLGMIVSQLSFPVSILPCSDEDAFLRLALVVIV